MGELIPLQTARSLRAATGSAESLARAARAGTLTRIRAGAYTESSNLVGLTETDLHLARIAATRLAAHSEPLFSHESAAALHGIPIVGEWPDRVRTSVGSGGASSSGSVARIKRDVDPRDVVVQDDGALATSRVRTALDLAASRSLLGGIVAISHLRGDGVTLDELAAGLGRCGQMPGIRRARLALARSAPRAESVLETLVWARLQDYCFEEPEQQREIIGIDDRRYRVDFAWREGRIVLEADGRAKHSLTADDRGRSPSDVLWAEKRREDAIRPRTRAFIRIGWTDAWSGHELLRRLSTAGVPRRERCASVLTF